MSRALPSDRAADLVRNALGRPPQDELEVAVVLEAWGGVRTSQGLQLGREANASGSEGAVPDLEEDELRLPEHKTNSAASGAAVLVAIVAMAVWAVPLSEAYGGTKVATAWRLALPITLALQSWFGIRHGSQTGLGSLPGRRLEYALVNLTAIVGLALFPAPIGLLGALLVMTWSTGAVLVQRGWFLGFAIGNVLVAFALIVGAEPAVTLGLFMTGLAVAAHVAFLGREESVAPGPNARAAVAGATGLLLGVLLIMDPSIQWSAAGYVPVVALVPALAGNVWAAIFLSRLWVDIPQHLLAHRVGSDPTAVAPLVRKVMFGTLFRFVGAALPLSIIVAVFINRSGVSMDRVALLLVGLGVAMVASLGILLLKVFGRYLRAFAAAGSGCAVAVAVQVVGVHPLADGALILGALVAIGVAVEPIRIALTHPDRTFATAMLLP